MQFNLRIGNLSFAASVTDMNELASVFEGKELSIFDMVNESIGLVSKVDPVIG